MDPEPDLAGKRVLICEDEGVTILQIQRACKTGGLEVVGTTQYGDEAVRLALQTRPDIVLMDVRLTDDVDGIEATRRILADLSTCVIMLSAYSDDATLRAAMDAGAAGYLVKPLHSAVLLSAVADLWRSSRQPPEIAAKVTLKPPKRTARKRAK